MVHQKTKEAVLHCIDNKRERDWGREDEREKKGERYSEREKER